MLPERVSERSPDDINRPVWEQSAEYFEQLVGFLDRGEERSLLRVADAVRGTPILDLGVGGGRTTALLRLLSDDYVGIDYTRAMVDASRRRFPDASFEHADARDLSEFPDAHFGLVFFSFNGIDAVSHADRLRILRAVRRVLRPGGYFVFNSHNHAGPAYRDRPWHLRPLTQLPLRHTTYHVARRVAELPFSLTNFRRLQSRSIDDREHGLAPSASHHFGILIYFAGAAEQCAVLETEGFDGVEIYGDTDGRRIERGGDTSECVWLYYVARKG